MVKPVQQPNKYELVNYKIHRSITQFLNLPKRPVGPSSFHHSSQDKALLRGYCVLALPAAMASNNLLLSHHLNPSHFALPKPRQMASLLSHGRVGYRPRLRPCRASINGFPADFVSPSKIYEVPFSLRFLLV